MSAALREAVGRATACFSMTSGLVAASLEGDAAAALFAGHERTLEEAQAALDTANPHESGFALVGMNARLSAKIVREKRRTFNVIGYLAAEGEVGHGPVLVLGAHYDHLGHGGHGNSLAGKEESGKVHPGADDNASGIAALLAVARDLKKVDRHGGMVLAFWSGEELGLLGSADFVRQPVIPPAFVSAYINLDMVGRARDNRLVVQAVGSSAGWSSLLEQTNVPVGFDLGMQQGCRLRTETLPTRSVHGQVGCRPRSDSALMGTSAPPISMGLPSRWKGRSMPR